MATNSRQAHTASALNWNPEIAPYKAAASEGRLALKRCRQCSQVHFYPRTICPFCFSDKTEWFDASGRGVIYSYSIQRRVANPYVIAYVTLEEGPTMMTNIVGAGEGDDLRIGQAVTLDWRPGAEDEPPSPVFKPA